MAYQRDEHRVHLIVYHPVGSPKRRKPLLTGAIAEACRHLMEQTCAEPGGPLLDWVVQPDPVQLFVQVGPSVAAAEGVRPVKGVTSRAGRRTSPAVLKQLPSWWTRSSLAATAGNLSSETLQTSIDAQKGL